MAKLKTGEWFQDRFGCIGIVVNSRPDADGDVLVTVTSSSGQRFNRWSPYSFLDEWKHTERERFVSFRSAKRSDNFKFYALYAPGGSARTALIVAGCRSFTIAEAKAHWKARVRADATKALNKWSLAYVKDFEAHLKLVRAGKVQEVARRAA